MGQEMESFAKKENPFEEVDPLSDWQQFYQDIFGIETDFSNLEIPERQEGFDRLIVVAQGITPQWLYDKCKELFSCWNWTDKDLDKVTESERNAKDAAYAVWFRNRVEADEELKNLSYNDLKEQEIPGITLEERFIYELKYFKETGEHLDVRNVTLCSGSRYSVGRVPHVGWHDGRLGVYWYALGCSYGSLRSRQAVS